MMKQTLVFIICLFSFTLVKGQNSASFKYNNEPLEEVIQDIEKIFNIKFSFNPDVVKDRSLIYEKKESSLIDILLAIESQTDVASEKISNRYYILNRQDKIDFSTTQELEEVLISEYLTSGVKKAREGSVTLSPKKLGILPGLIEPDILQSLQLLPGIQSPTETASGLYIRGGTPDQNLILWDGIKIYHSGHFFGLISAFNPYIIDNVKLFKAGTMARYGDRISGVIDISSTKKTPKKTEFGAGFNMTHADVYFKMPISKDLAFVISARRSYKDVFNTFTFKNLSDRVFQNTRVSEGNKVFEEDEVTNTGDFFNFWDATAKVIYRPSKKNELLISSLFTSNKLDYSYLIKEFEEATSDELDINNQGISVIWNHDYNDLFSQSITGYYSNYDLDYIETNDFSDIFTSETNKKNSIKDYGVSYDVYLRLNSKNRLSFGYQLSSAKVDYNFEFTDSNNTSFSEGGSRTNNINSFYTDYKYIKNKRLSLNVGVRANYISTLKIFFLEPRLHCETNFNSNFSLRLSFEQLNQSLSQIVELNTQNFGLENQIWALADNNTIPALKSNQLSLGFNFAKNSWNLDFDFYHKKIKGLTSLTNGFDTFQSVDFSQGKSNISGFDFLVKKKFFNYRTWLSYSAIKNNFIFEGINNGEAFPGNFQIAHQLGWSHTYKLNQFDFSLGWIFRTGTPYTEALGLNQDGTVDYGKINAKRLPNYHHLDFSSTYQFNLSKDGIRKGKLGFSLFNIYNKKNLLSKRYRVRQDSEGESFLQNINNIGLGVSPNILFRVDF